jgi:hypothetical protein
MSILQVIKRYWWVFVGLLVLTFVIVFFTSCGAVKEATRSEWEQEMIDNLDGMGISEEFRTFRHTYRTPQGVEVRSVVPVPANFLTAIDEGFQAQIDRFNVILPEWSLHENIAERVVLMIEPNRTYEPGGNPSPPCQNKVNEPGAPCMFVKGIQTAGTVAGLHDRWEALDKRPAVVLPHQQNQNWQFREYFKATIHNEAEHLAGFKHRHLEPRFDFTLENGSVYRGSLFEYYLGPRDTHPWQWPIGSGFKAQIPHNCGIEF